MKRITCRFQVTGPPGSWEAFDNFVVSTCPTEFYEGETDELHALVFYGEHSAPLREMFEQPLESFGVRLLELVEDDLDAAQWDGIRQREGLTEDERDDGSASTGGFLRRLFSKLLGRRGEPALSASSEGFSDSVESLCRQLESPNAAARRRAAEALRALGEADENVMSSLLRAIEDEPDDEVRGEVLVALGTLGAATSKILAVLFSHLSHENPGVRESATLALQQFDVDDETELRVLRDLLGNADDGVRAHAASMLGDFEEASFMLPLAEEFLRDDAEEVRVEALTAVLEYGSEARGLEPTVRALLEDPSDAVRKAAATLLGELKRKI